MYTGEYELRLYAVLVDLGVESTAHLMSTRLRRAARMLKGLIGKNRHSDVVFHSSVPLRIVLVGLLD